MSIRNFLMMAAVLGAAGGAAAGGYFWMKGAEQRRIKQESFLRMQAIQLGLATHLETLDRPALRSIVSGAEVSKDLWEFRAASAENEEKLSPAFGRALLHCDTAFDRAECWTLTELTVDGERRFSLREEELDEARARRVPDPLDPDATIGEDDPQQQESVESATAQNDETAAPADESDASHSADRTVDLTAKLAAQQSAEAEGEEGAKQPKAVQLVVVPAKPLTPAPSVDAEVVKAETSEKKAVEAAAIDPDQTETAGKIDETPAQANAEAAPVAGSDEDATKAVDADKADAESDVDGAAEAETAKEEGLDAQPIETDQTEGAVEEKSGEATQTGDAAAEDSAEAAIIEDDLDAPAGVEEPASDESAADEAAALDPTHVVTVSVVNARNTPGKRGRVLAVVPEGQELVQLDQRGRWGRFQILGGDNDGMKVWIYDRLISSTQ